MSEINETLVPLYLFHRYQTEAAIKVSSAGSTTAIRTRGDDLIRTPQHHPAWRSRMPHWMMRCSKPSRRKRSHYLKTS